LTGLLLGALEEGPGDLEIASPRAVRQDRWYRAGRVAAQAQVALDRDDAVLRLVGFDIFRIPEQGVQDMGKLVCQGCREHDLSFGVLAVVVSDY
jgi:hypothetical protein